MFVILKLKCEQNYFLNESKQDKKEKWLLAFYLSKKLHQEKSIQILGGSGAFFYYPNLVFRLCERYVKDKMLYNS